jgi:transcriptional regulator with XRE-family HTH domain
MAKARIRRVLARNMRRLREANGLSQGALAADAGIYQELVSRIENGAANPELDTLGRIADALGFTRASYWRNDGRQPDDFC